MLSRAKKILIASLIGFAAFNAFSDPNDFYNEGDSNDNYKGYAGNYGSAQEFKYGTASQSLMSNNEKYCHTSGDTYFYGGYVFTYRLLNNSQQTVTNGSTSLSYSVDNNTPDIFHGLVVGIGKALTRYVDLQLAYVHEFRQTKNITINSVASENEVSMQGVDTNVLWIFNPQGRFQVGAKLGIRIADFHEKITQSDVSFFPIDDTTEVNPRVGLDFNFQLTSLVSFRVDTSYTANFYRTLYDGSFEMFGGLGVKI